MMIRNLDDVTLVPTPVRISKWTRDGHVEVTEEEMRAVLFPELKGEKVTAVFAGAMMGEPFSKVGKFAGAYVGPRGAGGSSSWELSVDLIEKGKRNAIRLRSGFPTGNVILLSGVHVLDFRALDFPPCKSASGLRWNCPSFDAVWTITSDYCRYVAGEDLVLIDTTEAAIISNRERQLEMERYRAAGGR